MSPSRATNQATRQEWRALGFFYDLDEATKCWRLEGATYCLSRFASLLRSYCSNSRNAEISEHEHFGPYMYLKVMTWSEPGIHGYSIFGTLDDLNRLAGLIDTGLMGATPGSTIRLGHQFMSNSNYELLLIVRADGFDRAEADPELA